VYDLFVRAPFLVRARQQALDAANLCAGEHILLVGVGTGADLHLLPRGVKAVGLDISPQMLARARAKLPIADRTISLMEGNAAHLPFDDDTFDAAVLTLVLSVVPDGAACFREVMRVIRPNGRAIVFDKFLPEGRRASLRRRLLNVLTGWFGTDVNRRFREIKGSTEADVVLDQSSLFGGNYRIILLKKRPKSGRE
jgi:ubiquinone/menaquinone biosynthesis C-methylase UbiE